MNSLDDVTAPACIICHGGLYADELDAYACRPCTDRVDLNLRELAGPRGLYARLGGQLMPGSSSGGPSVSGSRTAPVPLRLDVLNLMSEGGPVLGPLETWVRDWETFGRASMKEAGTLQQRVDQAVRTLRFNLPWAASRHLAFDEFAREVSAMHRACEGQATGEKPPMQIPVTCPCGKVLKVSLNMRGLKCHGCQRRYAHDELLDLPFAGRRIAA